MPDPLFSDLYRDTEHLTWAPAEQVRRRGRQRTRRTRIAAGLASAVAVAVIATGAVAVAGGPDGTAPLPPATNSPSPSVSPSRAVDPTPRPSDTPSSTPTTPSSRPTPDRPPTTGAAPRSVPAAAMLQLADLPDGFEKIETEHEGDGSIWFMTTVFDCDTRPTGARDVGKRHVTYLSPTESVSQEVNRYAGDGAEKTMAGVRRLASDCVSDRPGDSIRVLAEGLGGDEALLMGATVEGREERWLLVRQGDLVSEMPVSSPGVQISEAEARDTARKVAARLCAGTDSC